MRRPSVLRLQADSTLRRGMRSTSTVRTPLAARAEEGGHGVEDSVQGNGAEAAAEEFQVDAAEGSAGKGDGFAGGFADFNHADGARLVRAKAFGEGFEDELGRPAPEKVDDDVNALLDLGSEGLADFVFGLIERDDGVEDGGVERVEVAAGADNSLGAEMARDLDGHAAGDAGGAGDEHGVAGSETGTLLER